METKSTGNILCAFRNYIYSNSVELYEKLTECGVDCELITYENSDHMLMEDAKEMRPVREKVFYEFADRYL